MVFENPTTRLGDETGLLGGQVLWHFRVTFDQKNFRIRFEALKAERVRLPSIRTTGLMLNKDTKPWTVNAVAAELPAGKADMKAGDEVISINGKPSGQYTSDTFRQLTDEAERLELVIRRGEVEKRVTVPVVTLVE